MKIILIKMVIKTNIKKLLTGLNFLAWSGLF